MRREVRGRCWRRALALVVVSAFAGVLSASGSPGAGTGSASASESSAPRKVVVVGIPGLTWKDISAARQPAWGELLKKGAAANVSVRVSNRPGDGYLSLGAGRRADAGPRAGLAFGATEEIGGEPAGNLFRRITNREGGGGLVVLPIADIRRQNEAAKWSAEPGSLAAALAKKGKKTGAVGNADTEMGPLPGELRRLPLSGIEGEIGLHREVALAAMDPWGRVPAGEVGRDLLKTNPSAPFGISTSTPALITAFRSAAAAADVIFVETGDSGRADLHSLTVTPEKRLAIRRAGVESTGRHLAGLLEEIDLSGTLLIVVAPSSAGGPAGRGQLRPAVIAGPGFGPGILESDSTRRRGLVTMQDLTATIASYVGASGRSFGSGHAVRWTPDRAPVARLIEMNEKTVTGDSLRTPFSFALIALDVAIFALGLWYLRMGRLPGWLRYLLIAALSFPVLSHLTGAPVWKMGVAGAAAVTVGATLIGAALLQRLQRSAAVPVIAAVSAAGVAFYLIDLALGGPVQLDSIFGYTSVSGGRYYGLGNLGFAIFASSSILLAGWLAERRPRAGKWLAAGLLLTVTVWIGHPALGADVGGTLAMACTSLVFGLGLSGKYRLSPRTLLVVAAGTVAIAGSFAVIDLLRPASERSHLGEFLLGWRADPAASLLLLRRKVESAVSFGLIPWGLVVPVALLVFASLHRRAQIWSGLQKKRPLFQATFRALMVAATAGSLANDSGIVVGGMVLALTVPWALLSAGDAGVWSGAGSLPNHPGDEASEQIPALPRPV